MEHHHAQVPMQSIGPIQINGLINDAVRVPLATYESPLWPSVNRGAKVSRHIGGLNTTIIKDCMTRSILLEASSASAANMIAQQLGNNIPQLQKVVATTSRYAQLKEINTQVIGKLLYIRFSFNTQDAAGHNMVTLASDTLLTYCLQTYADLKYISVSGNFCTDKKASAVNGILGRGKYVVAEGVIPHQVCKEILKTSVKKIVELNLKKNLLGSIVAGGIRTANAHFANMLLAFYLATGQDAANIVEGSQGIVHCEETEAGLYFSVTLPNIIVGTVGNGKEHQFVRDNLALLGCSPESQTQSSLRLAEIAAATVWCGEISLLAAQTNQGELMQSHQQMERKATTT